MADELHNVYLKGGKDQSSLMLVETECEMECSGLAIQEENDEIEKSLAVKREVNSLLQAFANELLMDISGRCFHH